MGDRGQPPPPPLAAPLPPPPPSPAISQDAGARRRRRIRAVVATVLVPPLAIVAASTVPAALVLELGRTDVEGALWGGAFFGTIIGAVVVGPVFWALYAVAAVLTATASTDRRVLSWVFAALCATVGANTMVALLANTTPGLLATRALIAGLWCAAVGYLAILALPKGR